MYLPRGQTGGCRKKFTPNNDRRFPKLRYEVFEAYLDISEDLDILCLFSAFPQDSSNGLWPSWLPVVLGNISVGQDHGSYTVFGPAYVDDAMTGEYFPHSVDEKQTSVEETVFRIG